MDDETLIEAGRVLSKKNAERLRKAMEAISSILAEVDADDTEARESRRLVLAEARNVAERFEAYIHMNFTVSADQMFANGELSREERIALSGAIGAALDAFRATLMDAAPDLYSRDPYEGDRRSYYESAALVEDLTPVPLREAAVASDGTIDACIITPGWGSSGYYSAEVLRRDGPGVFQAGLQSFIDHPTMSEGVERPERSVRDLAGALAENARWIDNGWNGPGLYSRIRVHETERPFIDAKARDIGLSIIAAGVGRQGDAEGRRGLIVERLTAAQSVDFVTIPGRGGAIRTLAESFRRGASAPTTPTAAVGGQATHKESTGMDEETQTQTPGQGAQGNEGGFREAAVAGELRQLREAVATLQRQNADQARQLVVAEGERLIARTLSTHEELPDLARTRIAGQIRPTLTEAGTLDQQATIAAVETAVEAEIAYLNQIAGPGRIRGLGTGGTPPQQDPAKLQAELAEAFVGMGLSESAAKRAAEGR